MQCSVEWNGPEGMLFVCSTGSGHTLTIDGPPEGGGNNLAPRPMETLLSGAGACSAYDVVMILQRGRKDIRRCRLNITSERADTEPKVFTKKFTLNLLSAVVSCKKASLSVRLI